MLANLIYFLPVLPHIFYKKKREMGFGKKKNGLSQVNAWIKAKSRKSSRKNGLFMNDICIIKKLSSLNEAVHRLLRLVRGGRNQPPRMSET
jgi:hypothetical protein